jgi:hypothetical protein
MGSFLQKNGVFDIGIAEAHEPQLVAYLPLSDISTFFDAAAKARVSATKYRPTDRIRTSNEVSR